MKLFEVFFNNGLDYTDNEKWSELIVSKDLTDANIKASLLCDSYLNGWEKASFKVEEITEVDGYEVVLFPR
jgi:hypothetical protein